MTKDPSSTLREPAWLTTAKHKRAIRAELIKPYVQPREDIDTSITAISSISELSLRIASGRVTAYFTTLAHIHAAARAHSKSNCLTEILFVSALVRARELDTFFSKHGRPIGPLHGIPITLKDQFDVEGFDTTLGYVGRVGKEAARDSLLVKILRDAGAVILAKSNLPQSIMWCETENPLWGLTTHPRDEALTPGGSTGGEGVLLAENCSLVGWGTDIGGSARIPAHMLGLYGFKPSSGRLPYAGVQVSTSGQEHVPSVVGPMARSLSTIYDITKLVIDALPWLYDPTVHPLPWQETVYSSMHSRPLIIGLILDDEHVRPHPPITRVLCEAADRLEAAGHTIMPWSPLGHTECINIMDEYYTADGGEDIRRDVEAGGEPFLPHVEALVNRGKPISVYEYWALNRRKREAQRKYAERWNSLRDEQTGRCVDILLMPTMPHPAISHRMCRWVGYTKVWNLLDYTSLVLPYGKVDAHLDLGKGDEQVKGYIPRNTTDKWNWALYDPVKMNGLPLSLQIIGRRLEEEKVLGAAKVIEDVLVNRA